MVDGMATDRVEMLTPDTPIFCEPICKIVSPVGSVDIDFLGFGPLTELAALDQREGVARKVASMLRESLLLGGGGGKARSKFADAPFKPSEHKQSPKPKPPEPPQQTAENPEKPDKPAETKKTTAENETKEPDQKEDTKGENGNIPPPPDLGGLAGLGSKGGQPGSPEPRDIASGSATPYPKDKSLFLVSKAGNITLFPKSSCKSSCVLTVELNGKELLRKSFHNGEQPQASLHVTPQMGGTVNCAFSDGTENVNYSFDLARFNLATLRKATRENRAIEILNY
jgi:hypothetical protein